MDFADYRSELQLRKSNHFDERSLYYPLNKFTSRYRIVKKEGQKSGYGHLRPIYSMSVLGYDHFDEDDDALRIFQLYDIKRNKKFPKDILNLGYFELLKPNVETDNQRHWQDYFLQRPLSDNAPSYIKDALEVIKRANMKEEELDMVLQAEHLQSLYDDTIAYAKYEGREEGLAEGKEEIAAKMIIEGYPSGTISMLTGISEQGILDLERKMRL
jgi:predicted transposase/invertase (TIGR01784 family)